MDRIETEVAMLIKLKRTYREKYEARLYYQEQ